MKQVNNLVVISDLHCGCKLALCPNRRITLDDGGDYLPSPLQRKLWALWEEFWDEWVPWATEGEPFNVAVIGDVIDGVHHRSTTQISQNLADQCKIAEAVLRPVVERANKFYMVRGTEAHVGPSGVDEERLARTLNAVPNERGQFARHELWIKIGKGLAHLAHHIGTTGSQHYESTAIMKELTESFTEAGRWKQRPPDVVARGHRHRNAEIRIPTALGYGISFVTAGWQLKTPFAYKIAGSRQSLPQIGGSLIRQGPHDFYTLHKVWSIARPKVEVA